MKQNAPAVAPISALERRIVAIVAAVQFVNVLDFVIVMPMGPDFARGLNIPMASVGIIGGSYTLAAALAGVIGSTFLDRFDRKAALAVTMAGLVVSTAAAGFATGFASLVAARVLAGVFGGPATSIAIAAIADSVPPQRRGRAMATVMAAFSVASVVGIPVGLELGRVFNWRVPFFSVAGLGVVVASAAIVLMPSMTGHLNKNSATPSALGRPLRGWNRGVLANPLARLSLSITFLTTLGVFAVVPNIAAFLQFNLHYPRERLGLLYFVGGLLSFFAVNAFGRIVDRFGATRLVVIGTAFHALALWFGFISPSAAIPVMAFFVCYMLSGGMRMVPNGSLSTRVPDPAERAGFMSTQSAIQHIGSACGALLSSAILISHASGDLERMDWVAGFALVVALCVPLLTSRLEAGVQRKELVPQVI